MKPSSLKDRTIKDCQAYGIHGYDFLVGRISIDLWFIVGFNSSFGIGYPFYNQNRSRRPIFIRRFEGISRVFRGNEE